MKTTTFSNRLSKLIKDKEISRGSIACEIVISYLALSNSEANSGSMGIGGCRAFIDGGEIMIRPCFVRGSGRYISNADYTSDICTAFNKLGVKYTQGNDAPKGGKPGNFIRVKRLTK